MLKLQNKILFYALFGLLIGSFILPITGQALMPVNDAYESNDNQGDAAEITAGTYSNLVLDDYDEDWFVIEVPADEMITVLVEATNSSDYDEIQISIYNEYGSWIDDAYIYCYPEDQDNSTHVSTYSSTDEVYYIRLYPYNIDLEMTYQMEISFETITPDSYEPNEDASDASQIGEGTYEDLTLLESDDDWFQLEISGDRAVKVTLELTDFSNTDYYVYIRLYREVDNYYDDYYSIGSESISGYRDETSGIASAFLEEDATVYIRVYASTILGQIEYELTVETINPYGDVAFEYGVETEDELIYTATTNFEFFAGDYFYEEVEDYIDDFMDDEGIDDIFSNDFTVEGMIQNFSSFISASHDVQFIIDDIYNLDLQEGEMSRDYIVGSMQMGQDGVWQLPSDYLADQYEDWEDVLEPFLDPDAFDDFEDEMDSYVNELRGLDEEEFSDLTLVSNYYLYNSTDYFGLDDIDELDNGDPFPELPMEHFFPFTFDDYYNYYDDIDYFGYYINQFTSFAPLCYPKEFSFEEYYDFGVEVYGYAQALEEQYRQEEEEYYGPDLSFTIDELINMFGITSYNVDKQSVAATWSVNALDFNDLEDLFGWDDYDDDMQSEFEEMLSTIGVDYDSSSAQISMAIEYDRDMVLASVALYVDFTVGFDDEIFPESLDLGGETVSVSFSQFFTKEGLEPPTEEQISEGEVGNERNLQDNLFGMIPGFSGQLIGAISAIAIVSLFLHMKKRV
ncbi:MAG: hypothetical protein ACTSYI_03115 [Promethearchaeota archaeon]